MKSPMGTGVSDIRYMRWFNKTEAKAWTFLKFYEPADSESRAKNKMPLMRKPGDVLLCGGVL